jgi:hypothetical protein
MGWPRHDHAELHTCVGAAYNADNDSTMPVGHVDVMAFCSSASTSSASTSSTSFGYTSYTTAALAMVVVAGCVLLDG